MPKFKRDAYSKLLQWKQNAPRLPLIIRGARQVGKTFLLKEFGTSEFKNYHYLNFETDSTLKSLFKAKLDPESFRNNYYAATGTEINFENDLILLDEIQAHPPAITALKYFSEHLPQSYVIAAGSLLGLELAPTSYPVGKVELLNLYPLSFAEFLDAISSDELRVFICNLKTGGEIPEAIHGRIWRLMLDYMVTGGLPESIIMYLSASDRISGLKKARSVLKQLVAMYGSDFAKHAGKVNAMHIDRVFRSIPGQLAKAIDASVKKYRFKDVISSNGRFSDLAGPIDWLLKASLLLQCNIIETAQIPLISHRRENHFKLYMFDVGILGALADLPIDAIIKQDYGSYKGYFAENFVAQELTCLCDNTLYSWTKRMAEIEFLFVDGDRIEPIEVKAGRVTRSKSLSSYRHRYAPKKASVLSGRPSLHIQDEIIHYFPLYAVSRLLQ